MEETEICSSLMDTLARFRVLKIFLFLSCLGTTCRGMADVDKVYHPYVEGHKTEVEFRSLFKFDDDDRQNEYQKYRLGLGHSITDRFFMEGYLIAVKRPHNSVEFNSFELEGRLQLTEQGEYWADWGLQFEIERDNDLHEWEAATGLLFEKEWNKWIIAANYFITYETGPNNEFDSRGAAQLKYRLSPLFEPAVEIYMDETTRGVGPAFLGSTRLGFNKLKWEVGLIFGFGKNTPEKNLRFMLDYEF